MAGWGGLSNIIDNALQNRERPWNPPQLPPIQEGPRPPLHIIPQATPVGALKNRVALQNQYTPEATRILEESPTRVNYGDTQEVEGLHGSYHSSLGILDPLANRLGWPSGRMDIEASPNINGNPEQTLAHEFAHKWQDQIMNPQTRWLWGIDAPGQATDYASERVNREYEDAPPFAKGMELYANAAEPGPHGIPDDLRQQYYGMYRDNLTDPQALAPPIPPKPLTMPAVTPVGELKNRVALTNQYTPEAARELYETPTWVRFGHLNTDTQPSSWRENLRGSDGVAGFYRSGGLPGELFEDGSVGPGRTTEIAINGQNFDQPSEGTLAHEFAHKWYDKKLDPYGKEAWQQGDNANWHAKREADYRADGDRPISYYNELYAHNAERGPFFIRPEVRDMYYPGLYQDNITAPNDPLPSWMKHYQELLPDERPDMYPQVRPQMADRPQRRDESTPYGTEYWVNERNAPLGYFEDGGAMRPVVPFPSMTNPPQWPSVNIYDAWVDSGYRG
jgi:hypothetical protein